MIFELYMDKESIFIWGTEYENPLYSELVKLTH